MLHPISRLLLHLREHISHNLGVLARDIARETCARAASVPVLRPHDRHKAQLRPGQRVVEVVLEEVVLRQIGYVAGLDGGEEVDVGGVGGEGEDVDHFSWLVAAG